MPSIASSKAAIVLTIRAREQVRRAKLKRAKPKHERTKTSCQWGSSDCLSALNSASILRTRFKTNSAQKSLSWLIGAPIGQQIKQSQNQGYGEQDGRQNLMRESIGPMVVPSSKNQAWRSKFGHVVFNSVTRGAQTITGLSHCQRANQRKTVSNSSQIRKRSERGTVINGALSCSCSKTNQTADRASLTASTKAKVFRVYGVHLGWYLGSKGMPIFVILLWRTLLCTRYIGQWRRKWAIVSLVKPHLHFGVSARLILRK